MTDTALYVAASEVDADEGAEKLERAGSTLAVEPAVSVEKVRTYAPAVDCVVFAETPTTAAGGHLLEVIEAAGATPLVLYAAAEYGPAAARSTDGIDGYVRRDGEAAIEHLADEVSWICRGDGKRETSAPALPEGGSATARLREAVDRISAAADEAEAYERAADATVSVLEADGCSVAIDDGEGLAARARSGDVPAGLEDAVAADVRNAGDPRVIDDVRDRLGDGGTTCRSAVGVPIGEFGVLQAVAERPSAFGEEELETATALASHVAEAVARRRLEARLEEERDRFAALFEGVPVPAARCEFVGDDALVRDVNAAFEETFGHDLEAVRGREIDEFVVSPGTDEGGGRPSESANGERRTASCRRTADGIGYFLIDAVPLERSGRRDEVVFVYDDVTDLKRREREIAARDDRLEEFAEAVDRDLQRPLNVARGYLELLEATGDEEHVAEIEGAHERLSGVVDRLRSIARPEATIDETEPVGVHDAARGAWTAMKADGTGLVLEDDGIVEADKARLVELLEGLFRSAIRGDDDESGDGARPATVRAGALDDGFFVAVDGTDPKTMADDTVERIADAHGWDVAVVERRGGSGRLEIRGAAIYDHDAAPGGNRSTHLGS